MVSDTLGPDYEALSMASKKINLDAPRGKPLFKLSPEGERGGVVRAFAISFYRVLRVTTWNYCVLRSPSSEFVCIFVPVVYIDVRGTCREHGVRQRGTHDPAKGSARARKSRSRVTTSYAFDILKLEEA
jgi:hypothetical protein